MASALNAPDADAFLRAIVAAPGDALPRIVFADYLDELGLVAEALGQRWAAKHGKRPCRQHECDLSSGGWWTDGPSCDTYRIPNPSRLPEILSGAKAAALIYPDGKDLVECERTLLDVCGSAIDWSDDGEPLARKELVHP
jgi:uncharacterized protein (TIGR02996 family)